MAIPKRKRDHVEIVAGEKWNCLNCGRFNVTDELPHVDINWAASTAAVQQISCPQCATTYTISSSDTRQALLDVATWQDEHRGRNGRIMRQDATDLNAARRAKAEAKRRDALRRVEAPEDDPVLGAVLRADEAVALALEARAYAYFEASQKYSLRALDSALPTSLATIQRRAAEGRKLHDQLEAF